MAEGYTKLWASIVTSSIWSEDPTTCKVWITMLATADETGYVGASIDGLAALARVSVEATERAIALFMAPDPRSRSKVDSGRRIREINRGWQLINFEFFRDELALEKKRARQRVWARKKRATQKANVDTSTSTRRFSTQAEAEAEAEAEAKIPTGNVDAKDLTASARVEPPLDDGGDDRETVCPLDLPERAAKAGLVSELAQAYRVPPKAVSEAVSEFAAHWTVGAGAGKRRRNWMARLRGRIKDLAVEGRLAGLARPTSTSGNRRVASLQASLDAMKAEIEADERGESDENRDDENPGNALGGL